MYDGDYDSYARGVIVIAEPKVGKSKSLLTSELPRNRNEN